MIGQTDGGDGKNTTKVRKPDRMAITKVIYRRWVHFLTSLNSGGTYAQWRVYFLMSLNLVKTLLIEFTTLNQA